MRPRISSLDLPCRLASTHFASLLLAAALSTAPMAMAQSVTAPPVESVAVEPAAAANADTTAPAPMGAAPSATASKEKWHFSLTPYMWVPAMSGTVGARGRSVDVDVSQGDAFDALSDLDGAFALHFEAQYGAFSLFVDAMYYKLASDETGPAGGNIKVDVAQGLYEFGAAYRALDLNLDEAKSTRFVLEPLAGIRVFYLENDLEYSELGVSFSEDKAWANVFGGVRGRLSLFNDTLGIFARGDVGVGGSSNSSWNVMAGLDLRLAKWCSVVGGYRWLNIDYSSDEALGQFTFDALEEGPFLAFEFRF